MALDHQAPVNAAQTEKASSATAQTLLAANGHRRGFIILNGSDKTLSVLLDNSATPPTVTTTRRSFDLAAGVAYVSDHNFQGAITGISAAGPTGNIEITEFSV